MDVSLGENNFRQEVLEAESLVVVDFYADWCGPCKMMAPVIEKLAEEYDGQVKIGKCNVDEAGAIAAQYQVMNIPTIAFFKGGKIVDTVIGATSKADLEERIAKFR